MAALGHQSPVEQAEALLRNTSPVAEAEFIAWMADFNAFRDWEEETFGPEDFTPMPRRNCESD